MCESCLMPLEKDPLGEARESRIYCSYCFRDGKLCYEGSDVRVFKKGMITAMVGRREPRFKAYLFAFLAGFAPRWKKG